MAASHCSDKTGDTDANAKCWYAAGAVPLHRPNRPTDCRRGSNVRRSSVYSVGRSGAPIPQQRHYAATCFRHSPIPSSSSQNRLPGLSRHIPEGDFSPPVSSRAEAFLFLATRFGPSMFASQANTCCARRNRVRSFYVRPELLPFSIYVVIRRPS